jgi:ribosomal protein S18 acetylase RimI-like enzyme
MLGESTTLKFNENGLVKRQDPVRVAVSEDKKAALSVVWMGFGSDPMARWAYPKLEDYVAAFPEFIRAFAGKAFDCGTAYVSEGEKGAALWLPPGVEPDEEEIVSIIERTTPGSIRKDLCAVFEQTGKFHPHEPHWYLPMIAVDPFSQRRGIGSRLMAYALERCDEEHMPAYLASNPRNISLYERFGFEVIGIVRSGGSPPMLPMIRKPRSAGLTNRGS